MAELQRPRVPLPYDSQPGVMIEFDRSGLPTEASEFVRPVNAWPNQAGYANEHGRILSSAELEAHGRAILQAAQARSGDLPDRTGFLDELVEYDVREPVDKEQL